MKVCVDAPHLTQRYEADIPCEADPTPFALRLAEEASRDPRATPEDDVEELMRWATVDGSPIA